jgi:hypothetical protein
MSTDQMPFISAGILILEGSRQKTSSSVSVDGGEKASMTDHVAAVGRSKRRLENAGEFE